MKVDFELTIHFTVTVIRLLKPGGAKTMVANTLIMKQQLVVMSRSKKRSPSVTSSDRFFVWHRIVVFKSQVSEFKCCIFR
jgi:hypothetical protein